MNIIDMFENFDIRFWASNGITTTPRKTPAIARPQRSGSSKARLLMPALAAASLSLQIVSAEAAAQTKSFVYGAGFSAQWNAQESRPAEPTVQHLSFEQQSKALFSGLASGKLPSFSAELLSEARIAAKHKVEQPSGSNAPDWAVALAARVSQLKD
jgi:hypothetical protein